MKVSAQYAAEHFDELLSAQDRGENVEISRVNKPTLRLVATLQRSERLSLPLSKLVNKYRGKIIVSPDFNAQWLSDEIADEFDGLTASDRYA